VKIIECEQGGYAWHLARLGRPTASNFADIFTPLAKVRTGATPRRYMLELLGERLTGEPTQHGESSDMIRGTELEPQARAWYELSTGNTVRQVGLVTSDCGRWAGSPDGLTEDRGIEIKCQIAPNFLAVAESGSIPDDYMLQVQACLWITGLPAWDYVNFTDRKGLVPHVITILPDAKLHAAFSDHMPDFCARLDEMEAKMRAAGHGLIVKTEEQQRQEDIANGNPFA